MVTGILTGPAPTVQGTALPALRPVPEKTGTGTSSTIRILSWMTLKTSGRAIWLPGCGMEIARPRANRSGPLSVRPGHDVNPMSRLPKPAATGDRQCRISSGTTFKTAIGDPPLCCAGKRYCYSAVSDRLRAVPATNALGRGSAPGVASTGCGTRKARHGRGDRTPSARPFKPSATVQAFLDDVQNARRVAPDPPEIRPPGRDRSRKVWARSESRADFAREHLLRDCAFHHHPPPDSG